MTTVDHQPDASVTPDAQLPTLDDRSIAALREVGRQWEGRIPDLAVWQDALPVQPDLGFGEPGGASRGGFVQIRSARAGEQGDLEVTPRGDETDSALGRVRYAARRTLIGPPLRSTAIAEQRMSKRLALPVLSPDALSSVAYGPEAMLAILVLAGSSQLGLSLPIAAVLVVLMVSVGLGYRQVIRAYPHGGGSYIVASHSLGADWGLIAGAGLILDYILTVAVSVASGVAAITSALPGVSAATVPIGLAVIVVLVLGNLRGVRAAGALFAAPTYLFIGAIALIVIAGLVKAAGHGFHAVAPAPHHATEALGVLLILRAFASGATAMTGIEVISNAVPVFEPPEADNARSTLSLMIVALVAMFVGVVVVAHLDGASPGGQTVLSQIAHDSVGSGPLYAVVQIATTSILLIAANSAVNGFPRLLYFMARDGYAPRTFLHMGDRLAFTAGIVVLAVPAAILYVAFNGQTEPLIPLFAVGVFIAFTLAQSAMVVHWFRHRDAGWRRALAINALGAALSGAVALIAAVTKFVAGAWIVVVLIPVIVVICRRIHRHYRHAAALLTPDPKQALATPAVTPTATAAATAAARVGGGPGAGGAPEAAEATVTAGASGAPEAAEATVTAGASGAPEAAEATVTAGAGAELDQTRAGQPARAAERQDVPSEVTHLVVVPVAMLDLAGIRALAYAASLAVPVLAVHVSPSDDEAARFHRYWQAWGDHLPLEVVVSPYRATVAPLANYIEALHRERPELTLTVVVPEVVPQHVWQRVLHGRSAPRLRTMLARCEGIVITSVPFHLS